jgi:hypothetical protein
MRNSGFLVDVVEVFVGTLGIGFIVFGVARGVHSVEKLLFVPLGFALAGYVYWRQRRRRRH